MDNSAQQVNQADQFSAAAPHWRLIQGVMKKNSRVNLIYIVGLIPVVFVAGLLLFLTLENFLSGQATYGDKFGNAYEVEGVAAVIVNLGILGLVCWLVLYMVYLFKRSPGLLRLHCGVGAISSLCIAAGLFYGLS
ncbi:hypothetical protein [Marinobacter alexandrii]|uniref:hypothetical protein n=1 Tax=Marinobacter alexandrii TaxID=2570351 RepID=UPI002ABD4129|nr:hypothetical protein [Marinobacter alexandrii]